MTTGLRFIAVEYSIIIIVIMCKTVWFYFTNVTGAFLHYTIFKFLPPAHEPFPSISQVKKKQMLHKLTYKVQ